MKHQQLLTSRDWIRYFTQNAQTQTHHQLTGNPPDSSVHNPPSLLPQIREVISRSLPAWQLGETSDGHHLRAAARDYALKHNDPEFEIAVDFFIREEQSHGAALGAWLDLAGIPRKSRDAGDSLFRTCRYAIPNYAVWASVVVMVESMAEIYYAALRRISSCPLLRAQCERILRDEVRHIRFQCEHLALERRRVPVWLRRGLLLGEIAFYGVVCLAVWIGHGRLLRCSGLPWQTFVREATNKFRVIQQLADPDRYTELRQIPDVTRCHPADSEPSRLHLSSRDCRRISRLSLGSCRR